MAIEIYCVKCNAKTDSTNVEAVTMKNGRPATKAVCAAPASTGLARRRRRPAEPGPTGLAEIRLALVIGQNHCCQAA